MKLSSGLSHVVKTLLSKQKQFSPKRSFHSTNPVHNQQSERIGQFAEMVNSTLPKDAQLKDILSAVWTNPVITAQCPNLVIRLTSLRGEVSKKIWADRGKNPNDISILAVGTVNIPQGLPTYHKFLDNYNVRTAKYALEASMSGYDLLSKGSDTARGKVLNLFNEHYGFPEDVLEKCIQNSAITCGGMRGLKDIADACVLSAKEAGTYHRFIQPDNSFGTWWNIIERNDKDKDKSRREVCIVEAKPQNKLHLSKDEVKQFYRTHPAHSHESWYITPVGNPSGTKMTPIQLTETIEAIAEHNPKAIIILDSVYLRTLYENDAQALMRGIANDNNLLNQIVFVESFSKSHGLCRERLGMYFSSNESLFTKLHTANIAYSAGPGVMKDFQFSALGDSTAEDKQGVNDLHLFWMKERKGLYNYLMFGDHKNLFDYKQPHFRTEDLVNPCTLYILLKTRDGIKAQDVFVQTGALGVDTPMLSGHYIRFSVGQLTQPTFSKYDK